MMSLCLFPDYIRFFVANIRLCINDSLKLVKLVIDYSLLDVGYLFGNHSNIGEYDQEKSPERWLQY